ncbi:MAG: LacI family DNA-binding transcriptional regulator [Chloroflexota bacterium]
MKVTLREVAKQAGLSVTTVSRALNGHSDVAEGTKQAIRHVADTLGYVPNLSARRLKMEKADAIGLILPKENLRFSDPFFSDLLSGIVEQSAEYGLELNITTPLNTDKVEEMYLNYIRSRRVDGFILVRLERDDPRVHLLQKHNFPFVAFGRTQGKNNFAFVDEDSAQGIHQAVDHLVGLGHRRIAYIGEPKNLSKSHQRAVGYLNGLAANNLPHDPELIFEGNFRQRSGRVGAHHLLALDQPPTAIVAANDLIALGVISVAQERGLTVGKEVSVTGFDDIMLAEFVTPSLTTLHQPAYDMGVMMCKHLVTVINGEASSPPQTVLQPTLIKRNSTGKVH